MENSLVPLPLPDGETFARVWKRVMPEPDGSPIRLRVPEDASALNRGGAPTLTALAEGLFQSASALRRQAGRGGPMGRTLSALSAAQRQSLRRLTALLYLRTDTPTLPSSTAEAPNALSDFLRWDYRLCRRLEALAGMLEQQESDPCFRTRFHLIRTELLNQTALLFALLEQSLSSS